MLTRPEALELLKHYIHEEKNLHHAFSIEAIMVTLAYHFKKDQNLWGITGLLLDLDYEYTRESPEKHGILTSEIIQDLIPKKAIHAILAHNYIHTQIIPTTTIDKALLASDAATDLIIASTKSTISKKISKLTKSTLMKNFNDPSFTDQTIMEKILVCQDIGFEINEFLGISLSSLQKIHNNIV